LGFASTRTSGARGHVRTPAAATRSFHFVPSINLVAAGTPTPVVVSYIRRLRSITRMHGCMQLLPAHRRLLLHLGALLLLPRPPACPSCCCCSSMRLLPCPLHFPRTQGPPLPMPTSHTFSWNTCNMKHLLQHMSEIDETFRIYSYNICEWPLQHMQHPDKTLAT
jgi:hypothetical protein